MTNAARDWLTMGYGSIKPMTLPVSIVIPAHNRQALIRLLLPSYLRQGCAELIILDDASNPPIAAFDRNGDTRVRVVRLDQRSCQPVARMMGARAASQEYIFFGEDDVFLSDGCIENLLSYVSSGRYHIVAPRLTTVKTLPDEPAHRIGADTVTSADQVVDYRLIQIASSCQPAAPIEVPWMHATALMLRESVLAIGYDPAYRGNSYREETDFYVRAQAKGLRLGFVPGPPAFHYKGPLNPTTGAHEIRNLIPGEYWVFRNNFYFLRKNAGILLGSGVHARPYRDTLALMGRRITWYWRRLWAKAFGSSDRPFEVPL